MTEAEWLACTDPEKLLAFLWQSYRQLSDRKLLLFTVGCCRALSPSFPELVEAMGVFERYAEGLAGAEELNSASAKAWFAAWETFWVGDEWWHFVGESVRHVTALAVTDAYRAACSAAQATSHAGSHGQCSASGPTLCLWLRDLFHSPFRPVFVQRRWLLHEDGTARKLADGIYEDRAFDRLPILADALEDAGCTDHDVLTHCRSGAEHVQGCWALDALLGKR